MSLETIVFGVDPDSMAHGVAIYRGGDLAAMLSASMMEVINLAKAEENDVLFSIEDVMANQFVYARNQHNSKAAQSKIAMSIGRCQQSQVELMRALDYIGISYELHKPTKNNWAKNKPMFEKATGWTKRSNEDTRSAAYFGYLALKGKK